MVLVRVVEQIDTAQVHTPRPVRDGDRQRGLNVVKRNAHVAREEIAGANRHNAHRVLGAGERARHRAHRAVAAHGDHHIGAAVERLARADAAVFVEHRLDEHDFGQPFRLAVCLDPPAGLRGGGFDGLMMNA